MYTNGKGQHATCSMVHDRQHGGGGLVAADWSKQHCRLATAPMFIGEYTVSPSVTAVTLVRVVRSFCHFTAGHSANNLVLSLSICSQSPIT